MLADIPGLIEGAHAGAGLGDEFLRHVERTTLLVHLVDICPPDGDCVKDYRAIRRELEQYSPALAAKLQIVVANKMDLTDSAKQLRRLRRAVGGEVLPISAATGEGLADLAQRVWAELQGRMTNDEARMTKE